MLAMTKRSIDAFLSANACMKTLPATRLSQRELQLRHLLLDVSDYVNRVGGPKQPVVIRWAGGWVRDKMLGIESHDVDVAVNEMTGVKFAQLMREYCITDLAIQKHSIKPDDIGNLHQVARNPDKSKHLETAMLRIFGLEIDIVNLRKETYSENSRNPTVEFGTPEEDALRRDATINALFYNIHTGELEDFVGGLHDLEGKLIRTPLDPLETFKDDPLRVLRLVRFASHLNFAIDKTAREVMAHAQVVKSLQLKISRERVGTELEKMLKGNGPRPALELVDKLNLYSSIFTLSAPHDSLRPDTSRWHVAYNCLESLLQDRKPGSLGSLLILSDDAAYVAWNLAAMVPWMAVKRLPTESKKAQALPPVTIAAREGYKASKKLTDIITACHRNFQEILNFKTAVCGKEPVRHARDTLGMAIRRWDSSGGAWTLQVLNALLIEATHIMAEWPADGETGLQST